MLVLFDERLVETHLALEVVDLLLAGARAHRHARGIAGHDARDHEDHDREPEQNEQRPETLAGSESRGIPTEFSSSRSSRRRPPRGEGRQVRPAPTSAEARDRRSLARPLVLVERVVERLHRHRNVAVEALVHRVPHDLRLEERVDLVVDQLLLQVLVDLVLRARRRRWRAQRRSSCRPPGSAPIPSTPRFPPPSSHTACRTSSPARGRSDRKRPR